MTPKISEFSRDIEEEAFLFLQTHGQTNRQTESKIENNSSPRRAEWRSIVDMSVGAGDNFGF